MVPNRLPLHNLYYMSPKFRLFHALNLSVLKLFFAHVLGVPAAYTRFWRDDSTRQGTTQPAGAGASVAGLHGASDAPGSRLEVTVTWPRPSAPLCLCISRQMFVLGGCSVCVTPWWYLGPHASG